MPTLPVTPAQLAIALALTVVGSAIQGSVGIGFAVIVAPVLLLVAPEFVPGSIVLAAILLVILMTVRERRDVIVRDLSAATLGRILGTVPAAYVLSSLPKSVYELLFGALVMLGVLVSWLGWHVAPTRRNVFLASILSGFMSTVSSIGGPPMALVYQHEEGPRIRATISAIFTIGGLITLTGLWWAGRFHSAELMLGLLLMPGVVAGFTISRYTTARIDGAHVRPALLAASALCAIVVIVRALAAEL
ncbi:MAG: sulfite exporter TauE/SafE family protein [Planctomycetes bacterium]|nr:sulfite exporter TauE/SafE family protein [Planctomycetota bacterium]